jgi:Flp pilus assembly pilin Flp
MHNMIHNLSVMIHCLTNREEAQDLVEYALLLSLISTAVIAGAQSVAAAVNSIFTSVSTSLA